MGDWVIVYGGLGEGIQGVIGTFKSEELAEKYSEAHGLGDFEKFIYQLDSIEETKPVIFGIQVHQSCRENKGANDVV